MFDPTGLSRVELEPVMWRSVRVGATEDATAIWLELRGRTWQNLNPYAGEPPWSGAA